MDKLKKWLWRIWLAVIGITQDVILDEIRVTLGNEDYQRLLNAIGNVISLPKEQRRAKVENLLADLVEKFGEKFIRMAIEAVLDQQERHT